MFNLKHYRENYHPSPVLRYFQFFLLLLIILGLALLATEKIWVPKFIALVVPPVSEVSLLPASDTAIPIATATYACNGGKNIIAKYYNGQTKQSLIPDGPPDPGGKVKLVFSDGRKTTTLPQTISADGTRYANSDESFVFWGKGNGAIILENGAPAFTAGSGVAKETYTGCVQIPNEPFGSNLSETYREVGGKFTLRYPKGYMVDESYQYEPDPDLSLSGVKFTIPFSFSEGTNLSEGSYLSIENFPKIKTADCSAKLFFSSGLPLSEYSDENYSVASLSDAGAGNRYEETVYAIPGSNPCTAIRYLIHYMAFENYPAGAIKEFDKPALIKEFDQIRGTFILNQ